MSKPTKQFDYYPVKVKQAEFRLEFETLKDFLRYAENSHQKSIFLFAAQNDTPESFGFSHKGGLLTHPTEGFETLEDYSASMQNNFVDAATFYAARQLGFTRYQEYKMSTETGITDAKAYEEIKKGGYIKAYEDFDKHRTENSELPRFEQISNAHQLQQFIKEKGYENIQEFTESRQRGFADVLEYRTASSREYKTHSDYKAAADGGFAHALDFYTAREKGITEKEEYNRYLNLESLQLPELAGDVKVLLILLSKLPDSKKTSLNKIFESWQKELETYRKADGSFSVWFTTSVQNPAELAQLLTSNEAFKKYGIYDSDGEFFENKKLKDRMVIVDGSNVAHGSPGHHKEKPTLRHVLAMVKFLQAKGFIDITIFSDAALKHRLEDFDLLKDIKQLCKYNETPAETTADLFLIAYVKRHHCLIVSNDTFREWKMQDPWVAENMDYYRLSFMVNGEEVIMPDVEG